MTCLARLLTKFTKSVTESCLTRSRSVKTSRACLICKKSSCKKSLCMRQRTRLTKPTLSSWLTRFSKTKKSKEKKMNNVSSQLSE